MSALITGVLARAAPRIAAAIAVLAALFGIYRKGRLDAATGRAAREAAAYRAARERMDDVEASLGDDPDAARRWLHERGQSGPGAGRGDL